MKMRESGTVLDDWKDEQRRKQNGEAELVARATAKLTGRNGVYTIHKSPPRPGQEVEFGGFIPGPDSDSIRGQIRLWRRMLGDHPVDQWDCVDVVYNKIDLQFMNDPAERIFDLLNASFSMALEQLGLKPWEPDNRKVREWMLKDAARSLASIRRKVDGDHRSLKGIF